MTRLTTTPRDTAPQPQPLTREELLLVGGGLRYELKNVLVSSYSVSGHG